MAWALVVALWDDALYVLVFDDAYYYLEIGGRLVAGEGSTFDGRNPTNGYHPLWLWICALIGATSMDGVRGILLGQLALSAIAVGCLARVVMDVDRQAPPDRERSWAIALLFAGAMVGPLAVKTAVNGMESALYLALVAAAWRLSWLRGGDLVARTSLRDRLALAALFTLAFLARTDAALWLVCVGVAALPAAWRQGASGLRALLELFALPAGTILAFMATNQVLYGAPVQISGLVKRTEPTALGWLGFAACVLVPLAGLALARTREGALARWVNTTPGFLVGLGVMVGYYTTMQKDARPWYFGLHLLYVTVAAGCGAVDLLVRERRASARALRTMAAILVVPALVAAGAQFAAIPVYARLIELRAGQQALGERLDVLLRDGGRAGSWDAGLIGYRCAGPVTNLDGLVNSKEFLDRVRRGEGGAWVAEQDITWFANHGTPTDAPCGQLREQVGFLAGVAFARRLEVADRWMSPAGTYELCILHLGGSTQ